MSVNMEFKKRYNFVTLAPAMLGNSFKAMRVLSIMDARDAQAFNSDVFTTHQNLKNVISNLPVITDCTFYKFEDALGNIKVFALEYIDLNSIVLVNSVNVRVDILDTDTTMVSMIRDRLKELGINNFNVSIV